MEKPNLNYIIHIADGDVLFKNKFINILKKEFQVEKRELIDNLNNDLPRAASLSVNKIKYKMSVLGLEKGFERASIFEEELRDGCTAMAIEIITILELMDNYIREL